MFVFASLEGSRVATPVTRRFSRYAASCLRPERAMNLASVTDLKHKEDK